MGGLRGDDSGRPVLRFLGTAGLVVAGMAVLAWAGSCPAQSAADNVPGTRGAEALRDGISRTITAYGKDIQDAYNRELIGNPKIEGEITVSFKVRPDGDVEDVAVERSSLNWPPLEAEILSRVKAWKFAPFEGEPIPATVPYKFGSN